MEVTLLVAAPMLAVALVIGLIVSIFQAATQINEQTLSFIPKLVGIFAALVIAGPWMLSVMLDYMRQVFSNIPSMVN
jgi:flagellar biosynthetic protein FliQ